MGNAQLFSYDHFDDVWKAVLEPWFREQEENACEQPFPSVVLTPSPAWAVRLKERLLQKKITLLGLRFWTLKELRHYLLNVLLPGKSLALREDLHLFMALAAMAYQSAHAGKSSNVEAMRICESIVTTPEAFTATYDTIASMGFDSHIFQSKIWLLIAQNFEQLIACSGLLPYWQADRAFLKKRESFNSSLASVLMIGFEEGDWASITLMRAAAEQASNAILCSSLNGNISDTPWRLTWVRNWEQWYGTFQPLPCVCSKHSRSASFEKFEKDDASQKINYRIADNICEEASLIVQQTLCALADSDTERVGIVFLQPSALVHQVTLLLKQLDIPHYDNIGGFPPLGKTQRLILHWAMLQEEPELDALLSFMTLLCEHEKMAASFAKQIEHVLRSAFEDTLTNDLTIIRAYLSKQPTAPLADQAAAFLEEWLPLPPQASFRVFFEKIIAPLKKLVDEPLESFLRNGSSIMATLEDRIVDRDTFLKWLNELLNASKRKRLKTDNHPLAKVILLLAEDAVGLPWHQLIFAGLNQKNEPSYKKDYIGLTETDINKQNHATLSTGAQGKGHWVTHEAKGLIPSSVQWKALREDRLIWLTTNAGHITFTASRFSATDCYQPEPLSERLVHFYQQHCGEVLDAVQLEQIAKETKKWAVTLTPFSNHQRASIIASLPSSNATQKAFKARRDANKPFGAFEMSYHKNIHGALRFSCKTWENFLQRPASVWFEKVLDIEQPKCFNKPIQWRLTQGSWIHLWLSLDSKEPFQKRPDKRSWLQSVKKRATSFRHTVKAVYENADRKLPDWWHACWTETLHVAFHLVELLAEVTEWDYVASEWSLPKNSIVSIDDDTDLHLSGRMDLVFASKALTPDKNDFPSTELWIIDFKTGNDPALNIKHLQNGKGIQLALYAIALNRLGYKRTFVSLLKSDASSSDISDEKRLNAEELTVLNELLQGLLRVQQDRVFGMGTPIRSAYHFVGHFPLATLTIREDILARKWRRSHPLLPLPQALSSNKSA